VTVVSIQQMEAAANC